MIKRPLILLFLSLIGYASEAMSGDTLKFAVVEIGKPYQFIDLQGEPQGILVEITKELITRSGLEVTWTFSPYKRMLYELQLGRLDCALFFTSTQHQVRFRQLGFVSKKPVIIVYKEIGSPITKLTDFEGKRIGRIRGAHYGAEFDDNQRIIKREINTYEQAISQLKKGRIDGFIGAKESIDSLYEVKEESFTVNNRESWLQCSKQSPRLTQEKIVVLQQALQSMHHDDEQLDLISIIHRRYLKNYQRPL